MKELPSHLVSEDFYIWFNIKAKEEKSAFKKLINNIPILSA